MKKVILFLVVVGVIAACAVWYLRRPNSSAMAFRTVTIERGDLLATISATGTVEPEEAIDVGAQVTGKIKTIGKAKDGNEIDYGSMVDEGMVLAQIDDSLYAAELASAEAGLQQAKAEELKSRADLEQLQAKLYQAQRDWDRAQKLGPSEALAQSSYDSYKSAYEVAKANITVGQANITQAQASIASAQASLDKAKRNLGYCTIVSPVKGIIIDRRVNMGQTVVSSMSTSSLFLIAKDLTKMQIWVAVNEADIGYIYAGQPVSFTVTAFPGRVFKGQVSKIRLNATMTQNVVNYVVEINTDNSDGKLLPYLTADIRFELNRRDNVLQVPSAALRWFPATEQVSPEFRDSEIMKNAVDSPGSTRPQGSRDSRASQTRKPSPEVNAQNQGVLWVQSGDFVKPLPVQVGAADGIMTEISGPEVQEGLAVITGEQTSQDDDGNSATTSPFTPQFRRR
ncbi:MAG: HlyD family efflux transporter periplasmic adaptor subunit [Planctomycetes bacterium]|nr:HlyD family efflux transporter periplasmic adaptor subunit [Planctomycetota bacterium]